MNVKSLTILLLAAISFLSSCQEKEIIGPDIEGIGSEPIPTSSLEASIDSVDFSTDEQVHFEITFEQATQWLLTLTGQSSGATKTFTSSSENIDISNSNWDGQANSGPLFQEEIVTATLSFPSYPEVTALTTTFVIKGVDASEIESVLISDFSSVPIYNFGTTEPAGGGWGSDFPITVNTNTTYAQYDANPYLYFEGAPWQANSPYIDILQIHSNLADTLTDDNLPLYSDPDRVYINLAVYNTGTEDTWFRVEFNETSTSESRLWDIRPDWTGWKYISIKYSDLASDGSSQYDPSTISLTNFILFSDEDLSNTNLKTVSIAVDQFVISFDSPLGTVNY